MIEAYLKKRVESIEVKERSVSELLADMVKTAFQGRKSGKQLKFGWKC
mgnify:CR=1 FL=1